ncbi:hypothetical protein [Pseudarthrobacter sp. N5]|uniref:hypothetical protein n=1 Tax=Pseudarthrobacter sp. N5 TaxID=3418416 RepID=UPI003CF34331
MFKKVFAVAGATAALMLVGSAAFADDCVNVSRAPAACGWTCQGPVVEGNWVWLPSIGVPEWGWGFATPGSVPSVGFGFPGSNGNYLNQSGGFSWLLENGVCVNGNTARQTSQGIQSGCGVH